MVFATCSRDIDHMSFTCCRIEIPLDLIDTRSNRSGVSPFLPLRRLVVQTKVDRGPRDLISLAAQFSQHASLRFKAHLNRLPNAARSK
jgi:hypothetical protein